MSRRRKLTFTVSRTLLTGSLVASSALGLACDEDTPDVTVNPAYDATSDADAGPDDFEVSVNPVPDTIDATDVDDPDDFEVSVNPVPDTTDATDTSIEDEEWVSVNPCYDEDGDGYYGGGFCPAEDCNDFDASINPGAAEVCDGIDNDCNGLVDEDLPDHDGDGICDDNPPMCRAAGTFCPLDSQGVCCTESAFCKDIGQDAPTGEGVCCIPDGSAYANAPGDGQACCTKDLDGDGLCGDASP